MGVLPLGRLGTINGRMCIDSISIDRAKWELSHDGLHGNILRSLDLAESNKHHFLAALLRIRIIEKPIGPGAEDLPPIPPDHAARIRGR